MRRAIPNLGWLVLLAVNILHWAVLIAAGLLVAGAVVAGLAVVLLHDIDHRWVRTRIDEVVCIWTVPRGDVEACPVARPGAPPADNTTEAKEQRACRTASLPPILPPSRASER